uniref:Beta-1,4-galactosyltransferase n=1 Tax=Astyanax mexicanus TaxID=7994 RepID=A0A8B9JIL8_ASTMX
MMELALISTVLRKEEQGFPLLHSYQPQKLFRNSLEMLLHSLVSKKLLLVVGAGGVVKLLFESSLTLAQVQEQNGEVIKGQYEPADCTARQSVAILIPHRNREKHLLYLLYHLHPFLQRQQLHYAIYVIHQAGEAKFNRAKLLNVGYLEALKDFNWDCFIFHDVDLVPENDQNLYRCEDQPKHLVVGRNSTGYRYAPAVLNMLYFRVQLQGMKIIRPPAKIGRYTMVFHKRDSGNEVNKDRMRLLGRATKMWKKDGLNSCTYQTLTVERPLLYINVTVDIGKPHSNQNKNMNFPAELLLLSTGSTEGVPKNIKTHRLKSSCATDVEINTNKLK